MLRIFIYYLKGFINIKAVGIIIRAGYIAYRDDLHACIAQSLCGVAADVAEALYSSLNISRIFIKLLH